MVSTTSIRLMAAYTEWQNQNIYSAASALTDGEHRGLMPGTSMELDSLSVNSLLEVYYT